MGKFAFIIHPLNARRDVARRYPIAKMLPERAVEWIFAKRDPMAVAHITGIRSATGAETEGWFIACPFTPRQFLTLPVEQVYDKLEKCGHIAEELGCGLVGLGAFTSVVGDGGIALSKRLSIAVTTGNSYTVATALRGAERGARLMGIRPSEATAAVIGATGSVGATCAEVLARDVAHVVLIGRSTDKLAALQERLAPGARAQVSQTTDIAAGLRDADIVIAVSSAAEAIVQPQHIKRGAVVCDVARPRDVSVSVARERDDVLIIEGGVVQVPGPVACTSLSSGRHFSFGFPPGTAYACMSETMALTLEGRMESFTLGKDVNVGQVAEISEICDRHGFRLAGFRSFERAVEEGEIAAIRARAGRQALPDEPGA